VVIAAFREARTIAAKLRSLAGQSYPRELMDVVVVCDGSDDGTPDLAREAGAEHLPGRVQVIEIPRRGKPSALNRGAALARGDVLVFADARQELNREAIASLLGALSAPDVGVVSGELVLSGAAGAGAYWRYEAWIRRNESRAGSVIGVSGALYAMPRRLFRSLPEETILDDVLVPMRVRMEHPTKRVVFERGAQAFDAAQEHGREFARKARTLAGNFQLLLLEPRLLLPWRNPSFLAFVSHKLFRLAVPYALGLVLVVSLLGAWRSFPDPVWTTLVLAQLGGYGLALLHLLPPLRSLAPVKLCSTFVVLNAAAVMGLWRVLRHGRRQPWT
jgi:cellulose synthase/poly-beta-1,6-N-acetylglucosamine synthase-like glycosyltransferase